MTETGTIAFIGGMELDTTKGKYEGYKEAAAYVAEQGRQDGNYSGYRILQTPSPPATRASSSPRP